MKKWLVVLLVFWVTTQVAGQQYWARAYPKVSSAKERALGIWPAGGGGYLAARTVMVGNATTCELLRLDDQGVLQAVLPIPNSADPKTYEMYDAMQLQNGDILFLGQTQYITPIQQYLRRVRPDGTLAWSKTYPLATGTNTAYAVRVSEQLDSQLVVLRPGNQYDGAVLHYYDASGNFLKKVDLLDSLDVDFECYTQLCSATPDGYWAILHGKFDTIYKYQALLYSPDHRLLWQKKVSNLYSLNITAGGKVGVTTFEVDTIAHLAKVHLFQIDSTGQEVWNTLLREYTFYGNPDTEGPILSLTPTSDGGYAGFITDDGYSNNRVTHPLSYHFFKVRGNGVLAGARDFLWPAGIRYNSLLRNIYATEQGDILGFSQNVFALYPFGEDQMGAFKMDSLGFFQPQRIVGAVRVDPNFSCTLGPSAQPLEGCMMRLDRPGMPTQYARTDSLGQFYFETDGNTFTLTAVAPGPQWKICTPPQKISLTGKYDTATVMFSAQPLTNDPVVAVDLVMPELKRCQTKTFEVHSANRGIVATDSTLIWVALDPAMTFVSASVLPQKIAGDTLLFRLKGLPPGGRSKFTVKAKLACAGIVTGQVHTLRVWAAVPQLDVLPVGWSGSDLHVSATCEQDTAVQFLIRNEGSAPAGGLASYQVLHDHFILQEGVVPSLLPGQSVLRTFPAEAGYWRLELKQELNNPWGQYASAAQQACAGPGTNLALPLLFTANDDALFEAVESRPNDWKTGKSDLVTSPVGYGATHLVRVEDDLEYTLFFKNDTDRKGAGVRVLDTLSEWLDLSTLRVISVSHPYQLFVSDERALRFDFPETDLRQDFLYPDESSGYVRFRVRPKPDVPLGTRIENRAKVWVNYFAPVTSNTVWHTIGDPLLSVSVKDAPRLETPQLSIVPNPAANSTWLRLTDGWGGAQRLILYDLSGRRVRQTGFAGDTFELKREDLPVGFYWIEITGEQGSRITGKVIFSN